jgi:rhodanese-related sulfurtransferase
VNYALRADMTKAEFVQEVTTGLLPPPAYFPLNVAMNKNGYDPIDEVMERGSRALSPRAFETAANETGALVLDTRNAEDFAKGFIPNSINIGIDGGFAPWVGALIPDVRQEILLVTDAGRETEVVQRLARVGYDYCIGFLEGGMQAWMDAGMETDQIQRVNADELATVENALIFDVRKPGEYETEHIEGVKNTPLDFINDAMAEIPKDRPAFVHCAGGYRSMIFSSILRARGYDQIVEVRGGFKALKDSGKFETVTEVSEQAKH